MSDESDSVQAVLAYHQISKHRLPNRYARSLGYLDWDTQPNPFRLYEDVERVALVRPGLDGGLDAGAFAAGPSLSDAYDPSRVESAPVSARAIAQLFFDSLAISAWKQFGPQRWSLRCNPSSGNLHPTEAHVITPALAELGDAPTLWHYTPLTHALERRATLAPAHWDALRGDGEGVLVGLGSIIWREAWKYGERAYRYCQHDVGHAVASLAYAAAALGWHTRMLTQLDDAALTGLLGLDTSGPEAEHADLLLFIGPRLPSSRQGLHAVPPPTCMGTPNLLSEQHHPWPVNEQVARACTRVGPVTLVDPPTVSSPKPSAEPSPREPLLRELVRARRSAVDMDGVSSLSRAAWLDMLARTFPRENHVPFASLPGRAFVHLLLFVHRVDEVEPGLYLLLRDREQRDAIAASMHGNFCWEGIETGPLDLPLFLLERSDARRVAALLSCRQAIAADGAFAVAMLAELEPQLRRHGAWMYRHLHWEAGAIGQVLYLEAEAAGLRATGIGCFFDDGVRELLGIGDHALASIYHFTVGGPVHDPRLQTLDAYHHLDSST